MQATQHITARKGVLALSPAIVFLILYVAVSSVIGDFYVMPVTVALCAASIWAMAICRGQSLNRRIEIFSRAAGHSNILYMLWIFVLAGAFAQLAKGIGAIEATVDLTLSVFPTEYLLPGVFVASCFISMSIGTSVGTVVALTPLAVNLAETGGGDVGLMVATVLSGAFFGDNLSFISDTTIAATRSQGCGMADKFKANVWLVVPAAVITTVVYLLINHGMNFQATESPAERWWLIIPYITIIVGALAGINVLVVLCLGIGAAIATGAAAGITPLQACGLMGEGIDSMGQLCIVTLLAAGMLGIVKWLGGIDYLLRALSSRLNGRRGAQWCIAALVSVVNLCTANNTVAIITVGSLSNDISRRYGISPQKTASLLDTCSCIVQCLIPYGAQTLLATGLAGISPAAAWPYLYYPWALALMVAASISFGFPKAHKSFFRRM